MVLSLLKSMVTSRSATSTAAPRATGSDSAPRIFNFHGGIHPAGNTRHSPIAPPLVAAPAAP